MMDTAATRSLAMTRRAAVGLALASALPLAAGGRDRLAAAEPVPDTWTYAGDAARTGAFPGPGLDLERDIIELWRIDGGQTGTIVDPCGVCDGIAYYRPVPNGVSADITPLVAVDAQTGAELWRHDPPVTEPSTQFSGAPAISDGLLAMPTYGGLVAGIDARTGEERWVFDVQGMCVQCRPAIVDGVLFVSDTASVSAVQLGNTPEWLWKSPLGDGTTTVVSGTVSVDGDAVVVSSVTPVAGSDLDEKVTDIHVLNVMDGAEAYRYQFRDVGETYQFAVQDGMLYSRADRAYLGRSHIYSMSIDGQERWGFRTTDVPPTYPAVRGEFVYVAGGNGVWGYDAATGQSVWNSPQLEPLNPDIVLIDGVIYVGAAPPTPMIYALSTADGTLLRSISVPFDGAQVIGVTDGVLIARSGLNLVALANRP